MASLHSLFPPVRQYTQLFYKLPYPSGNGQYVQGADDGLFVLGWLILMTALRATTIEGIYQLVTQLRLVSKKACMRFAEQGFLVLYYGASFSIGMVGVLNSFHHIRSSDESSNSTFSRLPHIGLISNSSGLLGHLAKLRES